MNFSNFVLWEVNSSMVIQHEQCILTLLAEKEIIVNNLSKLIELKSISTTLT